MTFPIQSFSMQLKIRFCFSIICQQSSDRNCVKNTGQLLVFIQNLLKLNPKKTINLWDKSFKRAWAFRQKSKNAEISELMNDKFDEISIARSATGLHSPSICGVYNYHMSYFVYVVKEYL